MGVFPIYQNIKGGGGCLGTLNFYYVIYGRPLIILRYIKFPTLNSSILFFCISCPINEKYQIQEEMSGEMGLWVVVIVILTCVLSEGNLLGDHIFSFAITSIWNELSRNGSYYGMTQNIYHNHHFLSPPPTNQSSLPVVMFLKSDHFDFRSYMRKITRIFFTIHFLKVGMLLCCPFS